MDAISYTDLRNNLSKILDKVHEDHSPVLITRQKGSASVLISLEDYRSLEETAYLMRSPKNAKYLIESIKELESANRSERTLIE